MPPGRTWLWLVLVLAGNFWLARVLMPGPEAPVTIPYTLFKEEVGKGNVQAIYAAGTLSRAASRRRSPTRRPVRATAAPRARRPQGAGRRRADAPKTVTHFATTLPSFVDPGLEAFLIDHGVEISAKPIEEGSNPGHAALRLRPGVCCSSASTSGCSGGRRSRRGGMGAGLMGIGKSKARRYDQETDAKVTFDDVAGIDEAENELVEIVDFLKNPPKYTRLGGTAPKGVLLVGAPGTGKTLLARRSPERRACRSSP